MVVCPTVLNYGFWITLFNFKERFVNIELFSVIWGLYTSVDCDLLPTLRRILLPPSSGWPKDNNDQLTRHSVPQFRNSMELFWLDRGVCLYCVLSVATDHLISSRRFISVWLLRLLNMHIDDIRRKCLSLTAVLRISWLCSLKIFYVPDQWSDFLHSPWSDSYC